MKPIIQAPEIRLDRYRMSRRCRIFFTGCLYRTLESASFGEFRDVFTARSCGMFYEVDRTWRGREWMEDDNRGRCDPTSNVMTFIMEPKDTPNAEWLTYLRSPKRKPQHMEHGDG